MLREGKTLCSAVPGVGRRFCAEAEKGSVWEVHEWNDVMSFVKEKEE